MHQLTAAYSQAVVLTVHSNQSVEQTQTAIESSFESLFISYCHNNSECTYAPSANYSLQFLEITVDNVKQVTKLTTAVLYGAVYLPAKVIGDFFQVHSDSFFGISIVSVATYSGASNGIEQSCEINSDLIAAIVLLSAVSAALLIVLLSMAM